MRYITHAMATLLVAGVASAAYARVPSPAAVANSGLFMSGYGAVAAAQDQAKPPREAPEAKPPKAERQEMHPKQQEKADQKQQKKEMKQDKEQGKDNKHAAGKNARIPDRDYKTHFGQQHKFAVKQVITTTRIVPRQTVFVYSGYSFMFMDPWPMGWGMDDDVYIDYMDGGYFLLDPMHPGMQVALTIAG